MLKNYSQVISFNFKVPSLIFGFVTLMYNDIFSFCRLNSTSLSDRIKLKFKYKHIFSQVDTRLLDIYNS